MSIKTKFNKPTSKEMNVLQLEAGHAYKVVKDQSGVNTEQHGIVVGLYNHDTYNKQGRYPCAVNPESGLIWDNLDEEARFVEVDIEINVLN